MKLKDCLNLNKNKTNNQMMLTLRKRVMKKGNLDVKDIMNMDITLNKKIKKFEEI